MKTLISKLLRKLHWKHPFINNYSLLSLEEFILPEELTSLNLNSHNTRVCVKIILYLKLLSKKNLTSNDIILIHYVTHYSIEGIWDNYIGMVNQDVDFESIMYGIPLREKGIFETNVLKVGLEKKLLTPPIQTKYPFHKLENGFTHL